ncbi:LmeA family phospholipid-binding protein [soil metagenome]
MRPFRPLDALGAVWSSAAALPPISTGAAAAYRTLFMTVRRLTVGRRLTVRLDDGDLTMLVADVESRLDVRRLAVGQLDDVTIAAVDIGWDAGVYEQAFDRATVVARNVHLRPGAPPVVVAAPVELSLDIPTAALDDLFLLASPRLAGEIGTDGVARVRWASRPLMGHLEVDAQLDGSALFVKPRILSFGRRRWVLPVRTPAYRVRLPRLPHGLQLTEVEFEPGVMRVRGTLPEWRMAISRRRLENLISQLSSVSRTLNLTRPKRG